MIRELKGPPAVLDLIELGLPQLPLWKEKFVPVKKEYRLTLVCVQNPEFWGVLPFCALLLPSWLRLPGPIQSLASPSLGSFGTLAIG